MNEHDLNLYRQMLKERDDEISRLRMVVVKYGDRQRMAFAEPSELQQAIDRAFEHEK